MKKILPIILISFMVLVSTVLVVSCGKKDKLASGYVTVEVNPAIELTVNSKGEVTSANGLNDEGKMILIDIEINSKSVEEVVEIFIEECKKTGYLIEEKLNEASTEIKVSVSAELEEIRTKIETKIETKVQEVVKKLNLNAKFKEVEAKSRAYLEDIAKKYNPALTDEEAANLTYEQLFAYVELSTIERASLASVELEKYYNDFKAQQFKLKYKEELASKLDEGYSVLLTSYNKLLTSFRSSIDQIKDYQYNTYVSPESDYQKAMDNYYTKKAEILALKKEIAIKIEAGESVIALNIELRASEAALNIIESTLKTIKEAAVASLDILINSLEKVYTSLEELEKTFPESIDFEAALTKVEEYATSSKNNLLELFESKIDKEKLAKAKQKVIDRKAHLTELITNTK